MISSSIKIRTMSVLGLALAIIALLIVNLTDRIGQVPVPDDGVSWRKRGDAIEATSIRPGSAADRAGLIKGDHLKYINLNGEYLKVEDLRDVYFVLEEKIGIGGYVTYTIEREIRDGQKELWDADLKDVDPEPSKLPFELYLAAVGVIFLLVGIYVLIKQPSAQYTIHFYFVCLSVFSVYSLSSLGTFSLIDSLVLLIDSTGFIFLAPLFLHFCLRFPFQREILQKKRAIFFIYLPAAILVGLKTGLFLFSFKTPALLEWLPKLSSLEVSHFTIAFVVSTVILLVTFLQTRTSVLRQQLKWIAWGLSLSVVPFTVFYAYPFLLGRYISQLQIALAIGPSILLPVSFGYSIVRYRLMDVDIIVRRSMSYALATISIVVIFMLGVVKAGEWVRELVPSASDGATLFLQVAVMSIAAMLFSPIKNWLEERIDRIFFGERYDYRHGIAEFGRTLSSTTQLQELLDSLANRLSEMLSVKRLAIFIGEDRTEDRFCLAYARDLSEAPVLPSDIVVLARSKQSGYLAGKEVERDIEAEQRHLHYYIPCYARDRLVAIIGLGKTVEGVMLTSEDIELVRGLSGYVAVAIENSLLYRSVTEKAIALERLKDFNENIIESISIGLVSIDREGVITNWNSALEELLGITKSQAIGHRMREVFEEDLLATIHSVTGTLAWDIGQVYNIYRYKIASRDSRDLVVNISLSPLEAKDRKLSGSLMLVEDITVRVRLEEQMRENDKLSSIGLLAAGVAHEVNTPLTGISSYTQMLLAQMQTTDPKYTILEKIKRQTMRASDIVNNLLNFSRTSSVEFSEVDVNRMLDDTLQLLEPQLRNTQVKVEREYSDRLPKSVGSSNKLQQVFMNLFLNARDAMPQGGQLTIKTQNQEGMIFIDVTDTGVGIAPENIAKIYDPFFTTKSVGQGTGLGLAVSYGIIQEHNGRIFVESRPGQGTRFRIKLPSSVHRLQAVAGD